jgi:hypothetical protein
MMTGSLNREKELNAKRYRRIFGLMCSKMAVVTQLSIPPLLKSCHTVHSKMVQKKVHSIKMTLKTKEERIVVDKYD